MTFMTGTRPVRWAAAPAAAAPSGRGATLLRSVVVTVTVIALSAAAHTVAGGTLPAPVIIAALGAVLMLPVRLLVARQRPARVLLCILAAGQLLLHELFGLLSPHTGCPPPGFHAGHHVAVTLTECTAGPVPETAHLQTGDGAHSDLMLLAHVAAAAVTAVMIARGESALRLAAGFILSMFRLPNHPCRQPAARLTVLGRRTVPVAPTGHRPNAPRGPPAALAVT